MDKNKQDDLEVIVLATIMALPKEVQVGVFFEIDSEDFSDYRCRKIFAAMNDIISKGGIISREAIELAFGIEACLLKDETTLLSTIVDASQYIHVENKDYYFEMLKKRALVKRLQEASDKLKEVTTNGSYENIIEEADNIIANAITNREKTSTVEKIGNNDFPERIRNIVENPVKIYGIETGISVFDANLDGIVPGLLTLVGGRPGTGKSALAQYMYYNIACIRQVPILCIDTETSKKFVEDRLLAIASGVSFNDILHGKVSYEELEPHIELIQQSPVYYYYMPNVVPSKLRAVCRKYKQAYGIECLFIDFLGSSETENSSIELGKKIKEIHDIATTYELGVVVFQQLNREQLDKTSGKSVKEVDLGHFVLSDQTTWYCDSALGLRFPTTVEKTKYQCNRMIDIPKNRFGKAGTSWPINFSGGSMKFENVVVL